MSEAIVDAFRDRASQFEQKSEESESHIPDPQLEITLLETEMQMSFDKVENQRSHKIRQQQKEMPRWQRQLQESLQRTLLSPKRRTKFSLSGSLKRCLSTVARLVYTGSQSGTRLPEK